MPDEAKRDSEQVSIEVVSEEVPEDTPTDEEREESQFFEEGPEVSKGEAEQFASLSKHPPEEEGDEMEREEVRDGV